MYTQEITRTHRTAFVIVLDRSKSMQEPIHFGKLTMTKAEALAYIANSLITELIDRCRRIDALRNYYDIAVVGYGNDHVEMLLDERGFIAVDELDRHKTQFSTRAVEHQLPDGKWAMVESSSVEWIAPKAEGNTPMYEAMLRVRDLVAEWCAREHNLESFPPVVIHITDGEASDCDHNELIDICGQIKQQATADGNVLLLNIHMATNSHLPAKVFPTPDEMISAGHYAKTLAECSSIMPDVFNEAICRLKGNMATPPFVGMGYNASIIELFSIINIGSRSVSNLQ